MPNKQNRIAITVMSLVALMALVLGFFISQHIYLKKDVDMSSFHGTLLDKSRAVHDFSLTGVDNKAFNNTSLQGHWTMMFFGFTRCGSVCPTTMAELGKMYRMLEEKNVSALPQIIMVTLDPEQDSLKQLGKYVRAFDPHFYGARGNEEVINAMTHELGIVYAKIARHENENTQEYDIEHTGTVMLFNPKGELSAFFTTPHRAAFLAEDYMLLVSQLTPKMS